MIRPGDPGAGQRVAGRASSPSQVRPRVLPDRGVLLRWAQA